MNLYKYLGAILLLVAFNSNEALAQKTWTNGNNSGNWFDDDNWDPAGTPGAGDAVIFNATNGDDCFISGAAECASISISAYAGTISFDALSNITCAGAATFSSGTFDCTGADAITFGAVTVNGGTLNMSNASGVHSFASLAVSSGTFNGGTVTQIVVSGAVTLSGTGALTAPSGELTIDNTGTSQIAFTAGTFTHNSGLVTVTLNNNGTNTISSGLTFNNITIVNPSSSVSRTLSLGAGTTTIAGTLAFSSTSTRTISVNGGGTINLSGSIDASGHNGTGSPSHNTTINLNASSGTQSIAGASSVGQGRLPAITINQSGSASVSMSGFINVAGNWTYSGTSSVSAGSSTVTLYGTRNLDAQGSSSSMAFNNLNIGSSGSTASVTLTGNVQVNSAFVINSGSTLTTSSNSMTLGGDFTNGGTFTPANSTVNLTGTSSQSLDFRNSTAITLVAIICAKTSNTATIADAVSISDSITCSGGTLNLNGNLTLLSTASKTAQVGRSTGTISGNAVAQRHVPSSARKWLFLASPVTTSNNISNNWQQQIHITGSGSGGTTCPTLTAHSNGFDATLSNNPSMLTYGESAKAWTSVSTTSSTNITAGTGYRVFVRGDRTGQACALLDNTNPTPSAVTLSATGTLLTGSQSINVTCSNGCDDVNTEGWNLIGNPYAASIDLHAVTFTNVSNLVHCFNPTGAYTSYNKNTQTGNASLRFISSGQAFWVRSNNSAGGTVAFTESSKFTGQTGISLFKNASGPSQLSIQLNSSTGEPMDETYLAFDNASSRAYEEYFDGSKMGYSYGSISTYNTPGNLRYAINSIAYPASIDSVYVDAKLAANAGTHKLKFNTQNIQPTVQLFLLDHFTSSLTLINSSTEYSFTAGSNPASYASDRFVIILYPVQAPLPVVMTAFNASKKVNGVVLDWATSSEMNNKVFEVERSYDNNTFTKIGEVEGKGTYGGHSAYQFVDYAPDFNGMNYYRLKQVDMNEKTTYTTIIPVSYLNGVVVSADISIFPNPAKDKLSINLESVVGNAQIRIFDLAGKNVLVAPATGSSKNTIDIGNLYNGIYMIEVSAGGSVVYKNKFIKN